MIQKIKKFDRSERELQEFLLFCIFTSGRIGKKSSEISRKLDLFLNDKSNKKNIRPFDWIELIASIKSNHGRDYLYLFLVEYGLLSNKRTLKCLIQRGLALIIDI
jgi:protein involved in ribonucleotide reduction